MPKMTPAGGVSQTSGWNGWSYLHSGLFVQFKILVEVKGYVGQNEHLIDPFEVQ